MQVVIPVAGMSERFERAGYTKHKALLDVLGVPIIAHVVDLFPGETDFVFVGNTSQLAEGSQLAKAITRYCPTARLCVIPPHRKGPVVTVLGAEGLIDPSEPVIVNYCDFGGLWDYAEFVRFVEASACAGAIPAYRGFHPHSLGSTYYAYLRERDGWVEHIQEKQPFTPTPQAEFASSGTYYFSSGKLLLSCFEEAVERGLAVNGEHYVSLAYLPLLERGEPVAVYEIPYFFQWGTPEDFEEFTAWSAVFEALAESHPSLPAEPAHDHLVVLAAGEGRRFADEGHTDPKPLIEVSGRPMVAQATAQLPPAKRMTFLTRRDLPSAARLEGELAFAFPRARIVVLDQLTRGQAETALVALADVPADASVTIAPCDSALFASAATLGSLLAEGADLVVWTARGHAGARRNPHHYGWVDADGDGRIRRANVKVPLDDPATDPIITGCFTFARAAGAMACIERLIAAADTVNGEFYLDTAVNHAVALGFDCRILDVDHYVSWGTPDEWRTFHYWQAAFDRWYRHPYRLERDETVPAEAVARLRRLGTGSRISEPVSKPTTNRRLGSRR